MNAHNTDNIFRSWQTCLTLVFATMALPAMAQEDFSEEQEQGTVPAVKQRVAHSPAYAARLARAKALAVPLEAKGMNRLVAFEYAYVAALAEEQGQGHAEDVLARLVAEFGPADVVNMLTDEEFAEMMEAVDEMGFRARKTQSGIADALIKRIVAVLQREKKSGHVAGRASGSTSYRFPADWRNAAAARHNAPVETNPAVWWLENFSGSILNHEHAQPFYQAPLSAAHSPSVQPHKTVAKAETDTPGEEQVQALSIGDAPVQAAVSPGFASLPSSHMISGSGGAPMMLSRTTTAGDERGVSDTTIVWDGDVSKLTDGEDALFDKSIQPNPNVAPTNDKLDVVLTDVWRPWSVMVDDTGVTQTKRGEALGNVGFAFTGEGYIADYTDEFGNHHATDLVKKGSGILVMNNAKNSYSGGTDVQGGVVYVADQGALGTGAVTMHDDTALWVNYAWSLDQTSSFRNPVISNALILENGASATVSYGDFIYHKVLSNNTSRVWRTLSVTGGISGDEESTLALQGYTSRLVTGSAINLPRVHIGGTTAVRNQVWYSGFILNRAEAESDADRFYGTVTLLNHTNDSLHANDGIADDRLTNRNTGAVKLMLSDDVLEFATLDATRDFAWMKESSGFSDNNKLLLTGVYSGGSITAPASQTLKDAYAAAGGTASNYGSYGLRQTYNNTITVSGTAKVGELKADLLGVTQDTYIDVVDYTEATEVNTVRVVTEEHDAHLVLGKSGAAAKDAWFAGTVGLPNQLLDPNVDGVDVLTKEDVQGDRDVSGTSVAGLSLTKVGDNAQYIHTAEVNNLDLQGGTLGFNNVKLVSNLSLESGTKLRLGVQDGVWTNEGSVSLTVGEDNTSAHRLSVITTEADADGAPHSARVEGSLTMNTSTEIIFSVSTIGQDSGERTVIIPASVTEEKLSSIKDNTDYLSSHSLLQVTAATGRAEGLETGGTLTLGNNTPLSISGINFLREDYADKVYFLTAADNISVTGGKGSQTASDFSDRVISLGYGFYGIISSIDGHGYYNGEDYITYEKDNINYLGQDYLVMRVAADPTRSWTGAGVSDHTEASNIWTAGTPGTYEEYLKGVGTEADVQWKENRAYTDGVSVKFGNMWMPVAWEEFLATHEGATVEDFDDLLTSNIVTKVGDDLFSGAPLKDPEKRTSNGVEVTFGGVTYGENGSYYDLARGEGPSTHYEQVVIDGTVRPGYVTVNSDFNLKQEDGTYVTVKDDTNYVFSGTGSIADATTEKMNEIYGNLLSDATDVSVLDNWKTGLAKGGTGTLVIQTQNSYSGGSLLRGGLTVMQNPWALGMEDPSLDKTNPAARGGDIEMSYGAGLMVDYYAAASNTGLGFEGATPTGRLTNNLLITHMADFDNTGATGDAQLFNNADAVTLVARLSSYDDAILTLRGASYSEADAKAKFGSALHTYAAYIFQDPVEAYGTIRMAGYLQGADGRLVDESGQTYKNTGGNVQLTVVGHNTAISPDEARWKNTTLDLSLNGSAHNVVALGSAFENGQPNTKGVNHYIYIGTIKDNGDVRDEDGNICAAIVSDAGADSFGSTMSPTNKYMVNLTLEPAGDARFNGNMGFGTVQNNKGELINSRGYVSLTKVGPAAQSIGNARLYDLSVKDSGLLHVTGSLSAHSITTAAVGAQHIHVGDVADSSASHTLIVGNNGVLSFDATTMTGADPLANLKGTESDTKYGSELTYALLEDGATVTAGSNWKTAKALSVKTGAEVTFNTHDYSMDPSVTSDMATTYKVDADLRNAFDSSHIIQLTTALSGTGVTIDLVNEQMSAGATADEKGKADSNGYIVTHDLNAYNSSSGKVQYGLQGNSEVNIGSKTILQSTDSAKTDSGIIYNVKGEDAALQFLESGTGGYSSYVHDATVAEGGRILFGGASVATSTNSVNTDKIDGDITKGTDVIITNKAGEEATVKNVAHNTANTTVSGVTYETTIKGAGTARASVEDAVVIVQGQSSVNKTLLQAADVSDTLIELQKNCSVTLENVTLDVDSQVQGVGTEEGTKGLAAVTDGATKVSNQPDTAVLPTSFSTGSVVITDAATKVDATFSTVGTYQHGAAYVQVAEMNQLAQTDVGGKGLTIGISEADIKKAARSGARWLAIQVTGSGQFLYESAGMLSNVTLTDYSGNAFGPTGLFNDDGSAFVYHFASSAEVAEDLGVAKSQVSDRLLYLQVTPTPEPATTTLSLLTLAALMARRKRRA